MRQFLRGGLGLALTSWALGLWAGCAGQIPRPTDRQLQIARRSWPDTTAATLADGRSVYVARCSGCHSLHRPSSVAPGEWSAHVAEMADRSHLDRNQEDALVRYLVSASEVGRSPSPPSSDPSSAPSTR